LPISPTASTSSTSPECCPAPRWRPDAASPSASTLDFEMKCEASLLYRLRMKTDSGSYRRGAGGTPQARRPDRVGHQHGNGQRADSSRHRRQGARDVYHIGVNISDQYGAFRTEGS